MASIFIKEFVVHSDAKNIEWLMQKTDKRGKGTNPIN